MAGMMLRFLFLLSASLVLELVSGQCSGSFPSPCTYTCHCADDSVCSAAITGSCGVNGCDVGWSGPKCQRENLARDLFYQRDPGLVFGTSSVNVPHYTNQVCDSNLSTIYQSTREDNPYIWFRLRSTHTVRNFRIYLPENDYVYGLQIQMDTTSDFSNTQLCGTITATPATSTGYDVTCSSPIKGRYVRARYPGSNRILTARELEVFGCTDYWYGKDCDRPCNCGNRNEVCDKLTGACTSGCPVGFIGIDCSICQDGYYGADCAMKCGNCLDSPCDKTSGRCPACKTGFWGTDCSNACGQCGGSGSCRRTDGTCSGGCVTNHYKPPKCDNSGRPAECADGYYGLGCKSQCGYCLDNKPCNKTSGHCTDGCAPGFHSPYCKTALGRPAECAEGYYGPGCTSRCGNCLGEKPCDKTSGHCTDGCAPGFHTPYCKTVPTGSSTPDDGGPVTIHIGAFAAIAVLLLIALVAVAVLLWKCLHYRRLYKDETNKRYVAYKAPNSNEGKPEVVYEEMPK